MERVILHDSSLQLHYFETEYFRTYLCHYADVVMLVNLFLGHIHILIYILALNLHLYMPFSPFFSIFSRGSHSCSMASNKSFSPCTDKGYAKIRVTFLVVDLEIWRRIKHCVILQ